MAKPAKLGVSLSDRSVDWLREEIARLISDPYYLKMLDYEKEDRKLPITARQMRTFIRLEWKKRKQIA